MYAIPPPIIRDLRGMRRWSAPSYGRQTSLYEPRRITGREPEVPEPRRQIAVISSTGDLSTRLLVKIDLQTVPQASSTSRDEAPPGAKIF